MASRRELEDQIARLTALVEEMRGRMAGLEGAVGRPSRLDAPTSRRDLLRLGGAAALGAVGAAAMRVMPAAATNGDPVLAGQNVVSTSPTTVTGAAAPAEILGGAQSDFVGFPLPGTPTRTFSGAVQGLGGVGVHGGTDAEGVDGFASGSTGYGVYGYSDTGTGVTGDADVGISMFAQGSGRIRQNPRANDLATGKPNFVPNPVEQVRDTDGTLWLSNPAGKWRRATTFEVFPNPRRVYGKGVFVNAGASVLNIDATTGINLSPSGVPAGAVAAWCAVQSYEPCVLGIYPAGSPDPGGGAFGVMGTAGISVQITYIMVPLNAAGHFSFTNRRTKARIYFDVWGYLSQSV